MKINRSLDRFNKLFINTADRPGMLRFGRHVNTRAIKAVRDVTAFSDGRAWVLGTGYNYMMSIIITSTCTVLHKTKSQRNEVKDPESAKTRARESQIQGQDIPIARESQITGQDGHKTRASHTTRATQSMAKIVHRPGQYSPRET